MKQFACLLLMLVALVTKKECNMKQKKHDFRKMSERGCDKQGCNKLIKLNVAERKPEGLPIFCYDHRKNKPKDGKRKETA